MTTTRSPITKRPPWTPPPSLAKTHLSFSQSMEALSLSRPSVTILLKKGLLAKVKYGGFTLITRASVDLYIAQAIGPGLPVPVNPLKKPETRQKPKKK